MGKRLRPVAAAPRCRGAPLPRLTFALFSLPDLLEADQQLLFQSADMAEGLAGPGYNVERLSVPYVPQVTGEDPPGRAGPGAAGPPTFSPVFSVLYTVGKILTRCKQTSAGTSASLA